MTEHNIVDLSKWRSNTRVGSPSQDSKIEPEPAITCSDEKDQSASSINIVKTIFRFFAVMLSAFWPVIKWVVSLDVFWQLCRTFYYWDDASVNAGWIFMLHFAGLVCLTLIVTNRKVKANEQKNA